MDVGGGLVAEALGPPSLIGLMGGPHTVNLHGGMLAWPEAKLPEFE